MILLCDLSEFLVYIPEKSLKTALLPRANLVHPCLFLDEKRIWIHLSHFISTSSSHISPSNHIPIIASCYYQISLLLPPYSDSIWIEQDYYNTDTHIHQLRALKRKKKATFLKSVRSPVSIPCGHLLTFQIPAWKRTMSLSLPTICGYL